jgi:hypothetical protein
VALLALLKKHRVVLLMLTLVAMAMTQAQDAAAMRAVVPMRRIEA